MAGTILLSVFMLHLSNRLAGSYTHGICGGAGNHKKSKRKSTNKQADF